jgi:tetratricopeptide (TPR) repeat protein
MIVDTSLEYLRRLTADVQGDLELVLDVANAYRYVAEVEGVTIGPNLGQVDNAERDLTIAEGLIQSVLRTQPANRMALLSAAQVAEDRMAVAWQGGRNDRSLPFARKSAEWLEKFNAGKADEHWAPEILRAYANVAHQYMIADRLDEALRFANRGSDLAALFDLPRARAGFLDTRALALRYQGDLDGALESIRESVRLNESAPTGYARSINLSMALAREGWILGDGGISLGRTEEAVEVLERAFQIADDLVHKDASDEAARSRLFLAGGPLAEILRHTDAHRALAVFDHTYRDMSQISSRLLQIREVNLLAGSSDALRSLGRRAEARQRLDQAFTLLSQLKLYPADKIEAGSGPYRALCARADYEEDTGNVARGIEVYEGLLDRLTAGGAKPETSLQDAVHLSHIWTSLAVLYRRHGRADAASALDTRRLQLWREWELKLPNNSFVLRQIAEKIAR